MVITQMDIIDFCATVLFVSFTTITVLFILAVIVCGGIELVKALREDEEDKGRGRRG